MINQSSISQVNQTFQPTLLKGIIQKRGREFLTKIERFYVLTPLVLYYFKEESDWKKNKGPLGFFNLADYDLKYDIEKLYIALYPKANKAQGVCLVFKTLKTYEQNIEYASQWVIALKNNQLYAQLYLQNIQLDSEDENYEDDQNQYTIQDNKDLKKQKILQENSEIEQFSQCVNQFVKNDSNQEEISQQQDFIQFLENQIEQFEQIVFNLQQDFQLFEKQNENILTINQLFQGSFQINQSIVQMPHEIMVSFSEKFFYTILLKHYQDILEYFMSEQNLNLDPSSLDNVPIQQFILKLRNNEPLQNSVQDILIQIIQRIFAETFNLIYSLQQNYTMSPNQKSTTKTDQKQIQEFQQQDEINSYQLNLM